MYKEKQKIVCITGMERSGSSMITRVLNFMGLYLGPKEKLILETDYNIKGCWEHKYLLDVSDKILKRFGGDTHTPPDFPLGWVNDPRLSGLENQARQIIQEDFSNKSLWGWKDTRCCLTLPFWQKLLPEMVYVICLRNPLDVAKSLVARNWAPSILKSANLWLNYNVSIIKNTHSAHRILVFYDDFLENLELEVKRLADFLASFQIKCNPNAEFYIDAFIEEGLQHYKTSLTETLYCPDIPFSIKVFYLSLLHLAKDENRNIFEETIGKMPSQVVETILQLASQDTSITNNLIRNLEKKEIQLANKEQHVQALLNSYSWRITSPLRKAYNLLKKRKNSKK